MAAGEIDAFIDGQIAWIGGVGAALLTVDHLGRGTGGDHNSEQNQRLRL